MRTNIPRKLWRLGLLALIPALGAVGCMRMAVLPTIDREIALPLAEPRPQLDVPHETTKNPTKIYRVGPHDLLRVEVRKDPTLSQDYPITEEGNILLPNVGPIKVEVRTTSEIEKMLTDSLSGFIRFDPNEKEVRVGVKEYHSKVIYVLGQVNNPGPKTMRADMMTLQEALYAAGLWTTDAAIQRTQIITPDLQKPIVQQIDLADVLIRGNMKENIMLKANDTVYVPARYSSNLSDIIRELLAPIGQVYDLKYKMDFSKNNNNNNNNSSSSNSSTK